MFDIIGEKGDLWLAKNQEDTSGTVGWIWSKDFATLARWIEASQNSLMNDPLGIEL